MTTDSKAAKRALMHAADDAMIQGAFNTVNPTIAYICGGMRRIAVDPHDQRVRRMLLRRGVRYVSKNQMIIYACAHFLPVDLFMDIGVNYAECLLALPLNYAGRVIGYEANPGLLDHIGRSIAYNDDIQNVSVSGMAMSATAGQTLTFYINPRWSGMSSMIADTTKVDLVPLEVVTTSIDSEVAKVPGVNLLLAKIDVEGYESQVLDGGSAIEQTVGNIIYLMEFDSKYIVRGGVEPEAFFSDLCSRFKVYEFVKGALRAASTFDAIAQRDPKHKGHIHVDLVLTKISDPEIYRTFKNNIVDSNMRDLVDALWINI